MRHQCIKKLLPSFLLLLLLTFNVQADLYTGTISNWPESSNVETIGDGTNHVSLWWSISSINSGWFYGSGRTGDSDVAFARGVTDISQITDASIYTFESGYIGPQTDADYGSDGVGDFLIWKYNVPNTPSYYGVLRIDDIYVFSYSSRTHPDVLDGTWWFQSDGTGDFSGDSNTGNVTPVPGAALLGLLGLSAAGVKLRKHS